MRIGILAAATASLVACSSDVTSSLGDGDAAAFEVRDTILVPVADVPTTDTRPPADTLATTAPPADTNVAPNDTTVAPDDTTVAPDDTAVPPADTTVAPDDTAVAPDDTTVPPDDTTVAPDDTAEDTTAPPADTHVPPQDTAAPDVPEVVVDPDPWAPGVLVYARVVNNFAVDDLVRVRFHPSGAYALVLGYPNKVLYYDAEARTLTSLGTLGASLADLDVGDDGVFVIVGKDGTQPTLWTASVDDQGALVTASLSIPTGTARIVTLEPAPFRADLKDPPRFVIGAAGGTDFISYAYLFDAESGLSPVKGFNTNAGLVDLMWGDPALQGGSPHVITSEGVNGTGSHSWVLASDLVVGNNWGGGFGNGGSAHWRPGGAYGIVCGWSSNKLYVHDGAWEMGTLPVPTGASPNAVRWRDARRALVVGRVIGSPPYAVVVEVRAGDTAAWPAPLVDQSIRDFDEAPWFGNTSSMHLLDVDWRPGVACDEGLIVGTDSGSSFSPTFGYAIRFHDSNDPACAP